MNSSNSISSCDILRFNLFKNFINCYDVFNTSIIKHKYQDLSEELSRYRCLKRLEQDRKTYKSVCR